jgi:acylphosphatase
VLLGAVLLTLVVWRLSQGPVNLDFLTGRVESALNADGAPTQFKIGGITLAWEGFQKGLDRPIDLRLHDIAIVDNTGHKRLEVPHAIMTLSVPALLIGRVVPRAVQLDGVRLTVIRSADNTIGIDVGSLTEAADAPKTEDTAFAADLAELMRPATGDGPQRHSVLSQLRHIRLTDLELRVVDRALGVTWTASQTHFDLLRRSGGGIDLIGSAGLALKDELAALNVSATSSPDLQTLSVRFSVGPIVPAALGLPGLEALALPVSADGTLELSRTLAPREATIAFAAGAGTLHVGDGTMPVKGGSVTVHGNAEALAIDAAQLILPSPNGKPDTTISAGGTLRLGPRRMTASLTLGLDHVAFADLPALWPLGLGGGARPWITENVTAGTAHDAHIELAVEANSDFSDPILVRATGTVEGDNVTVHWLRPVPPIEQGHVHMRIVDPDTIDIAIAGGRQRIGARTPIAVTGGALHLTGMAAKDQDADIAIQANGPLADIIALLKDPRLKLLSKHPIDLREPSGDATVAVKVKLPLENKMTMEDVDIGVTAHLRQGHLSTIAAGRDLDKAELDFVANKDQMTLKGTGLIGGIASTIDGTMNFRAGKPQDIVQRIVVTGKPTVRQLVAAGLDLSDYLSGEIPLSAVWSQQRGGGGGIAVDADLSSTEIAIHSLALQKPAGALLKVSARLRLTGDRLNGIDTIVADGTNATLRGSADIADGRLTMLRLDRLVFGRNDLSGTVRMPAGGPIAAVLSGASLDLATKLVEKTSPRDRTKPEPPPSAAWTLTGRFSRVLLANDAAAMNVEVDASNDGRVFSRLRVAGSTLPAGAFSATIAGEKGARRITATAADAGALLLGLDMIHTMQGGTLSLNGTFNDSTAAHALSGTAEITDFRIRNAPAFGRLLQSMTLYGLVDVLQGPGLAFARLEAPFVLSDEDLELKDARAFSPSLGMTAKGHLNMSAATANLEGTVVPAYFFNSLLGKIPFFGGIFSNEVGGGLFAARYTIRGPLADPSVSVNPLTMLTPGFLRGMFGNL